jgi:ectoine hydroxylase
VTLGTAQRDAFDRDGYLLIESQFAPDELADLRAASDRLVELSINSTVALGRRHPRLDAKLHPDGRVTIRKIQPINDLDEHFADLAADERLVGPMRDLMGDEPILMEEKLNPKHTVDTRGLDVGCLATSTFAWQVGLEAFPLHHDWGYYRQQGYPENTLSSAIAIDDCAGRGPLRVIPGSHLVEAPMADPDPTSGSGIVAPDFFDPADLVALEVPAGTVMVFHARLVHDSEPNTSGEPRRMMIYSHYPRSHDPDGDPDRRNRGMREYAGAFEDRYRELVRTGAYVPTPCA